MWPEDKKDNQPESMGDFIAASSDKKEKRADKKKETIGKEMGDGDKVKRLLVLGIIVILVILIGLVFVFLKRTGHLSFVSHIFQSGDTVNITESYYGGEGDEGSGISSSPTDGINGGDSSSSANPSGSNGSSGSPDNASGDSSAVINLPTGVDVSLRSKLSAPKQSGVMTEADIPAGATRIVGTANGFEPAEFTVPKNSEVILALTAKTERPVILTFYDPNMAAVSIGCGAGETRWVTFTTPSQAGEYIFRNDTIGLNGQTGKMIVK